MEPAQSIISRLGGTVAVAKICGVHRSRPWKWKTSKEEGGMDGIIPNKHAKKLIAAGREIGFVIPLEAFIPELAAGVVLN